MPLDLLSYFPYTTQLLKDSLLKSLKKNIQRESLRPLFSYATAVHLIFRVREPDKKIRGLVLCVWKRFNVIRDKKSGLLHLSRSLGNFVFFVFSKKLIKICGSYVKKKSLFFIFLCEKLVYLIRRFVLL